MLRDGFEAREVVHGGAAGRLLKAGSIVPADWNQLEHVWVFEYSRPGADNKFRLACSLQSTTRRMFIHAAEVDQGSEGEPLQDNICVMGLQLDNYVPAGDRCSKSTSWEGEQGTRQCSAASSLSFADGSCSLQSSTVPARPLSLQV